MRILFLGTAADSSYVPFLKGYLMGNPCLSYCGDVSTKAEVWMICKKKEIDAIITTNVQFIRLLSDNKKANLDNYAGSIWHPTPELEVLAIPQLDLMITTTTGKHLMTRYLSKLFKKDSWFQQTPLTWEIANAATIAGLIRRFSTASYIAVDSETRKENLVITCVGYCGIWYDAATLSYSTHSIVIPFTDSFWITQCGILNDLPVPKIFQRGLYDNAYFLRWGIPPINYYYDTLNLFHCWYAELPKRLDFITGYCLRDFIYWKDEADSATTIEDYYFYNAKDTWATANSFLAIMLECPAYVFTNYLIEFPMVFPCLHASMEGIALDAEERDRLAIAETAKLEQSLSEVRDSLHSPAFNPGSPVQVKNLMKILKVTDTSSSDAKTLKKASLQHPLNDWLFSRIIKYREAKKLLSSYLGASLLNGRYMYELNPAGTETLRLASSESQFWCGGNIQNTPIEVKSMHCADAGYLLAEVDYSQSEARCVAYVSGDENLIAVVEGDRDYHAVNAEGFFGVPYDDVLQEEADKKKNNTNQFTIRELSKRTNHGANYNMGAGVMLDTMGLTNVLRAKKMLKLPAMWTPKQVCQHLLDSYSKTYPMVKGKWYDKVKQDIELTGTLVSALGWTRYCFGKPSANKRALNQYVAHVPQNLSVSIINKAFFNVWETLVLTGRIRVKAQVHDSLLFQYRNTDPEAVQEVEKLMRIPVQITDCIGKTRTMIIPSDTKSGLTRWRAKR